MLFEEMLPEVRKRKTASRNAWDGTGKWIETHYVNGELRLFEGKPRRPLKLWVPSNTDILAEDWFVHGDELSVLNVRQVVMFPEEK
jgi:hypothetical protein